MSKFRECEICGAALDPGERCDCTDSAVPAIRCTQPPVIAESLDNVRQNLELLLADIGILPQNDDALKYVKQIRANLSKEFERMENQRKAVKKQVMEPYDLAEKKYKEYISGPYKAADEQLKKWVDTYQDGLKQKCTDTLKEYFNELCQANGIDFLPFNRCGVVVDMAMARQKEPRKALEQISNVVSYVRSDMNTILKMDDAAEVMAEYRNNLSLAMAISIVEMRKQEREQMHRMIEEQRHQQEQKAENRAALLEAAPEILPEQEVRFTVSFKATGSMASLKAMKAYGITLGITFEEIQ